jgi:hypothetical protein
VAELALSTVFAAVQIGVAILALYRGVAENERLMAIGALHFCVPSAQRKLRVRMIEFELGAKWFPALRGVTLLALNLELVAMRAAKRSFQRNALSGRNTA